MNTQQTENATAHNPFAILRFALPSLLSLLLFLVPFSIDGSSTILVAVLAGFLNEELGPILPVLILLIATSSAALAVICSWRRIHEGLLGTLFWVSWPWLCLRIVGSVVAVLVFFEIGPEVVWGMNTGQTMVRQLVPTVMTLFLAVIFLLPLMTEYGIMEFVGVLVSGLFRILFRLPGRGAIDAMASWLGAAPLGALVTTQQYERGHYNRREALSIISSFSLASVAFCLLIASILDITHIFLQFYGSVALVSIVLATIVCRLPPLSEVPTTYHCKAQTSELVPTGESVWSWALQQAVNKAARAEPWPTQLRRSAIKLLDLWFGLIPTVIAIGTVALILAEYTPLFNWISFPFRLYLELLAVPEAAAAAPSMVVGFADMILPAVLGSGIDSELTRFIIAGISVTQVIYMSEIGALILRSKIETTIWQLAGIFLLRTIIAIPLFVLLGHLLLD
jgi:nucleoside recognition membrane protein YjiH